MERREHVFSWQDYASKIMQEMCQGPNKAVVIVDRVSISITVDATIIRTVWMKDREHSPDTKQAADIANSKV